MHLKYLYQCTFSSSISVVTYKTHFLLILQQFLWIAFLGPKLFPFCTKINSSEKTQLKKYIITNFVQKNNKLFLSGKLIWRSIFCKKRCAVKNLREKLCCVKYPQITWKLLFGDVLRLNILIFFVNYFCLLNNLCNGKVPKSCVSCWNCLQGDVRLRWGLW